MADIDSAAYRCLATIAKVHAAGIGLDEGYAIGFLDAMWPVISIFLDREYARGRDEPTPSRSIV